MSVKTVSCREALPNHLKLNWLSVFPRGGVSPGEILNHVNGELAADNEACMFVTLFCGVLDVKSGEIRYANAGHNPPLVVRGNGAAEWLPRAGSLVAGAMPEIEFHCQRLCLSPGDSLFLYIDGVTEAMNHDQTLFSEERLINELADTADLGIKETITKVMTAISRFSEGAPQSDDITMMMIRYSGAAYEKHHQTFVAGRGVDPGGVFCSAAVGPGAAPGGFAGTVYQFQNY